MRLTIAFLAATSIFLPACDFPPVGAPQRYQAAEHEQPPVPQPLPPPDDGVCWVEGPYCSSNCTPCPEK